VIDLVRKKTLEKPDIAPGNSSELSGAFFILIDGNISSQLRNLQKTNIAEFALADLWELSTKIKGISKA